MLLNCSATVDATPSTIFACVDAPQHIVGWVEGAVEHVYLSERGVQPPIGQRFRQRLRQGRTIRTFEGEIIAWEPASHFGLRIATPAYQTEAHFRIAALGTHRSAVDYSIDIALISRLAKILGPVLKLPLGLFVRKQIALLKAYAEALQPAQDARA